MSSKASVRSQLKRELGKKYAGIMRRYKQAKELNEKYHFAEDFSPRPKVVANPIKEVLQDPSFLQEIDEALEDLEKRFESSLVNEQERE